MAEKDAKLITTIAQGFTIADEMFILGRFDAFLHGNHDKTFELFSSAPADFLHFVDTMFSGSPFQPDMHATLTVIDTMTIVNFCFKHVSELQELSAWDRMTLVNSNSNALFGLILAWFLSPRNMPFYVRYALWEHLLTTCFKT